MKKEIRELFCEISGAATKNLRIVNGVFLMLFIGAISESFSFTPARNTHYIVFVINTYILVLGYLCHYTIKNNKTEKILVIDVINYLLLVFTQLNYSGYT